MAGKKKSTEEQAAETVVLETCPVCGSAVGSEETCTQCGAGLDYYRQPPPATTDEPEKE